MADKYNKVEPKVHPLTLAGVIGFFVVIIALIFIFQPTNKELIYLAYEPVATADFTEDHPFHKVTYDGSLFNRGLEKIIEKEEVVLLFIGFPTCESCYNHIGAFQKYLYSTGFDTYATTIYYLNVTEDPEGMEQLMNLYGTITDATPQLMVFKDGEVIISFIPVTATESTLINRSTREFYEGAIETLEAE